MNETMYSERWQEMRDDVKSWWGRLDDFDLDRIAGRKDHLIKIVQEKYGFTPDQAMQEVEWRLKEFGDKSAAVVGGMTAKMKEFGTTAANKAHDAAAAVGDKMGSLAGAIRQNAPQQGTVAAAAGTVADGLDSAGSYLREKKFDHLGKDVTALVRTYPIHAVLIGVGVGYLLARRTR